MSHREVDFGWWALTTGQRARLSWREDLGVLYLFRPAEVPGANGIEEPLASCTEDEARTLLAGWESRCERRNGLEWVQRQISRPRRPSGA